LTVFEIVFADGLRAVGKEGGFIFFEKNLCREPLAKAVGKGCFLFF
jgi:hypothetical protein